MQTHEYLPYFHNGLLFLPEPTLKLLYKFGLSERIVIAAQRGLFLDDRDQIGEICGAAERAIAHLPADNAAYSALTADDTRFMLDWWDQQSTVPFAAHSAFQTT